MAKYYVAYEETNYNQDDDYPQENIFIGPFSSEREAVAKWEYYISKGELDHDAFIILKLESTYDTAKVRSKKRLGQPNADD